VKEFGEGATEVFPAAEGDPLDFGGGSFGKRQPQIVQGPLVPVQPRRHLPPDGAGPARRRFDRKRANEGADRQKPHILEVVAQAPFEMH
jgi:hypothetical protein